MNNRQSGNIFLSVVLALFAGVMGSVLTLVVTDNISLPPFEDTPYTGDEQAGQSQVSEPLSVLPDEIDAGNLVTAPIPSYENLNEALEQASEERAQLAGIVAQLSRQIDTIESDFINIDAFDSLEQASALGDNQPDTPARDSNLSRTPQGQIDSLVASGVDIERAQTLQSRQNQFQLARLELIDQAEREGWADSDQFSERLEQLDEQRPDLRNELGDDAYDRYLFEAGRSNRVVFDSIIPGSVADVSGLQAGDMVLSYADQRVFSTRDLQRATREGVRGESIRLTIDRQGQTLFFEVPRGPLGVGLSARQRSPS